MKNEKSVSPPKTAQSYTSGKNHILSNPPSGDGTGRGPGAGQRSKGRLWIGSTRYQEVGRHVKLTGNTVTASRPDARQLDGKRPLLKLGERSTGPAAKGGAFTRASKPAPPAPGSGATRADLPGPSTESATDRRL